MEVKNPIVISDKTKWIYLDKNESPFELDKEIKHKIVLNLEKIHWNRYPSPYYDKLIIKISKYLNQNPENIVLGSGSAYLISVILNLFSKKQIIITYPSFILFESHCNNYNIEYEKWPLTNRFEYDINLLPKIKEDSILILASPNNPTGSTINIELLLYLLKKYPKTIFVVDEVYYQFNKNTFVEYIKNYDNLIILRSFSKDFGMAGLRIGYLITANPLATKIRNAVLPFVLNHFSIITLETILNDKKILDHIRNNIDNTINTRNELYNKLLKLNFKNSITIYNTKANFILIKIPDNNKFKKFQFLLLKDSIKVNDLSYISELKNTIRLTVGTIKENNSFLSSLQKL